LDQKEPELKYKTFNQKRTLSRIQKEYFDISDIFAVSVTPVNTAVFHNYSKK